LASPLPLEHPPDGGQEQHCNAGPAVQQHPVVGHDLGADALDVIEESVGDEHVLDPFLPSRMSINPSKILLVTAILVQVSIRVKMRAPDTYFS